MLVCRGALFMAACQRGRKKHYRRSKGTPRRELRICQVFFFESWERFPMASFKERQPQHQKKMQKKRNKQLILQNRDVFDMSSTQHLQGISSDFWFLGMELRRVQV